MRCRVTYLGALTDLFGHHVMWHLRCEDGTCYLVSWVQFSPVCSFAANECACMAFLSDDKATFRSSREVACSHEPEPRDALAAVCKQLDLEMDGDL